jgi:DNA-binding MarR family transcriptional regulator
MSTETGPEPVPTELLDSLVLTSFTMTALLSRIAAGHDLSLTQLRMLAILRDRAPVMADLAAFLGLERSSVSGLIDRAVRRNLVRRTASSDDGRSVQVSLTAEGQQLAARATGEVALLVAPMTGALTPAEQKRLAQLLGKLAV